MPSAKNNAPTVFALPVEPSPERIADTASWLAARRKGLGASEAAAAVGLSKWMFNDTLARIKLGLEEPEDLSGNPAVERGKALEPIIRAAVAVDHPEWEIVYGGAFDIVRRPDEPWYLSTLDGRIRVRDTGRWGILEIKTGGILSAAAAAAWRGQVPENYFCQVLHQMNSWPEADFVHVVARLDCADSATGQTRSTREFTFGREENADQMEWLHGREREFWSYIERGEVPPRILPPL